MIQQGVEDPEGSNELRKMQLRELALLNGAAGHARVWATPQGTGNSSRETVAPLQEGIR